MTSLLDFALSMSHPSSRDLACRECGSAFSRKPGPGRDPYFCSPGCKTKAQNRERLQKLGIRTCARCQGAFTPRDQRQRFCSKSCASSSHWDGKPREPKPPTGCRAGDHTQCELDERHGTCSECGKTIRLGWSSAPPELRRCRECQRANPRRSAPKPLPPRVCELCEEVYVPKYRSRQDRPHPQRFCSKSCKTAWQNGARPPFERRVVTGMALKVAKARERRLHHAQSWDGIPDEEIWERDGWRCQIPGCKRRPIRRDAEYPHLRSKSIDHIIPLSLGGDDTATNKRASHLGCNLARGNRVGFEQVALFGVIREPPLVTRTVNGVSVVRPPRLCGACGEPLIAGKCELHLPVYFRACDHCGEWFASRDRKPRYCRDEACLRQRACQREARVRERMSEDAKERKRQRDRERRWIDPDYRARAIAATARWHDRHRASR